MARSIAQRLKEVVALAAAEEVALEELPALLAEAIAAARAAFATAAVSSSASMPRAMREESDGGRAAPRTLRSAEALSPRASEKRAEVGDAARWARNDACGALTVGDLVEVPSALIEARQRGETCSAAALASSRWYRAEVVRTEAGGEALAASASRASLSSAPSPSTCGGAPIFAARSLLSTAAPYPPAFDESLMRQLVGLRLVVQDAELSGVPVDALRVVGRPGGRRAAAPCEEGEDGDDDVASQEPGLGSGAWLSAPALCAPGAGDRERAKKRPRSANDENVRWAEAVARGAAAAGSEGYPPFGKRSRPASPGVDSVARRVPN
jgi:hypothetical protein